MASGPEHFRLAEQCLAEADELLIDVRDTGAAQYKLLQASIHASLAIAAAQLAGRNSIPRQWAEVLEP